MMMVFTIGVMSLSILGVPLLLKHQKERQITHSAARTIKQWKDTCCAYRRKGGEFRD